MRNFCLFILLGLLPTLCLGQTYVDHWQELTEQDMAYLEDSTRELSFEEIQSKNFIKGTEKVLNVQSKYWYKIHLSETEKKKLFINFNFLDHTEVYVPIINRKDYQQFTIGNFGKRKEHLLHMNQLHTLKIKTDSVDFSKPFYYNKIFVTTWAKSEWKHLPAYLFDNDDNLYEKELLQQARKKQYIVFFIGVVFISFFLFIVNFVISQYKSYLIYALYLLGVGLYYANREPIFLNLYNQTVPELLYYVNQITHILNIGVYIWFVFVFLDFKNNFPKVFIFTKKLLYGILLFGILYSLLLIIYPFFPYRFIAIDAFRLLTTLCCVGLFIYLMFQKPDRIATIVLIGSLVLIIGNATSLLTGDYTIFLKLMVLEIILFSLVVAIRNKQTNVLRLKNKYDLELEKVNTQSLKNLDQAKNRFYENITHEFRTPLTLILSPAEKNLQNKNLSHSQKQDFGLIQRNANRLLNLVNQMLDLVKLEDGNLQLSPQKGTLKNVLMPIIDAHKINAGEKGITFQENIHLPDDCEQWFDIDVVEKISNNLLSNAVKYTPKDGLIQIDSSIEDASWLLKITNDTHADAEIDVVQIFKRYYRADHQTPGTGIGLNITKELVALAKGDIKVQKLPNHKILFAVSLPFSTLQENTTTFLSKKQSEIEEEKLLTEINTTYEPNDLDDLKYDQKTPTLLIIEDNEEMRSFIVSNFIDRYAILEAKNGADGLSLAQNEIPDLIISDVMMPKMNGFKLCDAIKQNVLTSHIPLILLTAKVGEENEIQGFKTGADAYITKPFSTEKLIIRTQQLLAAQERLAIYYKNNFGINPNLKVVDSEAEFTAQLMAVLNEHITDASFDIEKFSQAMQMSRRQLHRKLKATTEMTPTEYLRNQRLKLATELLKNSDATVAEIAYEVGFNTPSYFSKCFKERFGCTPNEYINRG